MNRAVLLALLSHWRRAPLQLFTLIAGLALATGLWSGVQAINAEARASYERLQRSGLLLEVMKGWYIVCLVIYGPLISPASLRDSPGMAIH